MVTGGDHALPRVFHAPHLPHHRHLDLPRVLHLVLDLLGDVARDLGADLVALERGIIIVENAINILLGRPYYPIARGLANAEQLLPLDIPSGLPSQLLQRRPDIRSAEQRLVAQTERVGIAVAMKFPTLSLTGFLGVATPDISTLFEPDAFIGSITGQLVGPLFRFGQNKRRVE